METHSPLGKRKETTYHSGMPASKKKPATKPATKTPAKKAAAKRKPVSREHKVAATALKLVDEAAVLLRKGISTSASTSEKARLEAKKKAHALLGKAKSSIEELLDDSASVLRKVINKI